MVKKVITVQEALTDVKEYYQWLGEYVQKIQDNANQLAKLYSKIDFVELVANHENEEQINLVREIRKIAYDVYSDARYANDASFEIVSLLTRNLK